MGKEKMITKVFPGFTKSMDAETGIVEAYVSIMGIKDLDRPPDIIQMGAFAKSIQERGPQGARKIRVLHQHRWDRVIGTPLTLVEHPRDMLPEALLARYPEATGGLFARTQFVMEVQLGRETYALYKAGAMDEWSVGFDALQFDYIKGGETEETYRVLKEIRLWEYSPVTWGANPATMTTDVKEEDRQDENALAGLTTPVVSISMTKLDDASDGAESQEALTRRLAMKIKLLENELAIGKARSGRLK